jgi:hypothetical protein
VGHIDKRIVAVAEGANGSASFWKTGCQGILLRGEVLSIEVDAKALNPLKTTSIQRPAQKGGRIDGGAPEMQEASKPRLR